MAGRDEASARRLAREDVLRFLRERGGGGRIEDIVDDLGGDPLVREALDELEAGGLVERREEEVILTDEGRRAAEEVYRRHVEVERLFRELGLLGGREAHLAAHSLEHVGIDAGKLAGLASRGEVSTLDRLEPGSPARVLALLVAKPGVLARLYGVGLLPGRRVRVASRSRGLVIVEIYPEGRLAALDSTVAGRILVALER